MNLDKPYNRDTCLGFLDTFVPGFKQDIRKAEADKLQVTEEAHYLGESEDMDLAVFELTHTSSADARVSLSMDGFKLMKNSAVYRALIIYRSKNSDDWRFSLMTATPDLNEKGKVVRKLSNPRRFSFFLGPNAKINTPHLFLVHQGAVSNFEDLQKRFSLEVVNKQFYKQISEKFTQLVGGTLGKGKKQKTYKPLIKLPSQSPESQINMEFGVRLIGRIIFCWFLREKKSANEISLMPKDLLSFEVVSRHKDYYHSVLEPIFFEVLNKEQRSRREEFSSEPYSLIPYLNGGLFSPHEDDYYKRPNGEQSLYHNTLVVPDEWLKDLFEILETYNFTIDENTSFDEELSIDPEMLGRIFENLLAEINPETGESARKSTGSYYTPRVIVDYMVDESILLYLQEHTKVDEEKLRAIISYDLSDDDEYPLAKDEKRQIVEYLSKLKLLDPACGSGAFPIGALQKIVFILQQADPDGQYWLKKQLEGAHPEFRRDIEKKFSNKELDFLRKLGIIRECIFGIDIQPIATEIARLRCFLTLIVDERIDDSANNRGIKPLPNLDFKFVTANSLIDLPKIEESEQMQAFDDSSGIDELKYIRDQYFGADGIDKERLKTEFETAQKQLIDQLIDEHGYMGVAKAELTQKLTSWEPFTHKSSAWFDPEWMFGINNGFDIVIGNPPYGVSIKGDKRDELLSSLGKVPDFEIYYYFIELALKLLRIEGISSYIVPNTFLFNVFASNYRLKLLDDWNLSTIIDCTSFKLFDAATVHNAIFVFQKTAEPPKNIGYKQTLNAKSFLELSQRNTSNCDKDVLRSNNTNWGLVFSLPSSIIELVNKIASAPHRIDEIFDVSQGYIPYRRSDLIKTYGEEEGNRIVDNRMWHSKTKQSSDYKEEIFGKSLTKYSYSNTGNYVKYGKHLACYVDPKFFNQNRLLVREITNPTIIATYIEEEFVNDPQIISIINKLDVNADLLVLWAILNSKLATFYHFNSSPKATKGAFPKILVKDIKEFPLYALKKEDEKKIIQYTDSILSVTKSEDYSANKKLRDQVKEFEMQIDKIVYKLYDLTPEEIKIVESSAK
ncbi:N-6 DNA methylase [Patescibacteria group bacterium]|nr:N-6 DNA methylase [Patescibacteria group bacterium]